MEAIIPLINRENLRSVCANCNTNSDFGARCVLVSQSRKLNFVYDSVAIAACLCNSCKCRRCKPAQTGLLSQNPLLFVVFICLFICLLLLLLLFVFILGDWINSFVNRPKLSGIFLWFNNFL